MPSSLPLPKEHPGHDGQPDRATTNGPLLPAPVPDRTWKAGTLVYTAPGLVALFGWLLWGDFSLSMRDRSAGPMSQWFLSQLNVPNVLFGLLVSSFPALIAILVCPVIGVRSDRHRGRWGRRIPFLFVITPIAACGMVGIAFTPIAAQWIHLHVAGWSQKAVSVACFALFWAMLEAATFAGTTVFSGLVNDVVPRELLGRFYGLFRAVSLVDGMIFNYWIMGRVPEHFTLILASIGVFYGGAFLWICFKIREGAYPPPPPLSAVEGREGPLLRFGRSVGSYCRECFSHPYYLAVFLFLNLANISFAPVNTFAIPYARSLGIDMKVYGKCLTLTFLISLGLSYFLGWLADAIHPLRLALATLALYAGVMIWGRLCAATPEMFLAAWIAHGVLSGCYFTGAASLAQRLFPHEKFTQFSSAAGICTALAGMALGPAMGLLIDGSGGVYRHAFTVACGLSVAAFLFGIGVYVRFMRLGGPEGYVAPE